MESMDAAFVGELERHKAQLLAQLSDEKARIQHNADDSLCELRARLSESQADVTRKAMELRRLSERVGTMVRVAIQRRPEAAVAADVDDDAAGVMELLAKLERLGDEGWVHEEQLSRQLREAQEAVMAQAKLAKKAERRHAEQVQTLHCELATVRAELDREKQRAQVLEEHIVLEAEEVEITVHQIDRDAYRTQSLAAQLKEAQALKVHKMQQAQTLQDENVQLKIELADARHALDDLRGVQGSGVEQGDCAAQRPQRLAVPPLSVGIVLPHLSSPRDHDAPHPAGTDDELSAQSTGSASSSVSASPKAERGGERVVALLSKDGTGKFEKPLGKFEQEVDELRRMKQKLQRAAAQIELENTATSRRLEAVEAELKTSLAANTSLKQQLTVLDERAAELQVQLEREKERNRKSQEGAAAMFKELQRDRVELGAARKRVSELEGTGADDGKRNKLLLDELQAAHDKLEQEEDRCAEALRKLAELDTPNAARALELEKVNAAALTKQGVCVCACV